MSRFQLQKSFVRRSFSYAFVALFSMTAAMAPLYADDFWQKKDYRQWTAKECQQVLEKSPWSNHEDIVDVTASTAIRAGDSGGVSATGRTATSATNRSGLADQGVPDETSSGRAANNTINYVVQFTSAPPIRKAVVRERLIAVKVDEQPPDKKQAYQAQADQFVSAQFPDTVLVHVSYRSNVANFDRQMATYWQHQTLESLKNDFYLIGAHGRVAPVSLEMPPGSREFELTFPRTVNGEPLVSPADKDIAVEFTHPPVGGKSATRIFIKFKVKDMVSDGKVIY